MTAQPATAPPSSDLLPCPFCNGKPVSKPLTEDGHWIIQCAGEYGGGVHTAAASAPSKAKAIAAWNRRAAIPDDKAELLAVLRDVYNSACTNKDAFLKARALLAKHGAI